MARAGGVGLLLLLLLPASAANEPCCNECRSPTVKYWALDTPNHECAETCLDPKDKIKLGFFELVTGFQGKQAGNNTHPCKQARFSTFNRTDAVGAGPAKIELDKYLADASLSTKPATTTSSTLPPWPPTYDMALSTIMMPCNYSGFMDPEFAAKWGLVDFDWSNAKQVSKESEDASSGPPP